MGLFDIDYDNIIVKKDIVMGRVLCTIDNFYKYPKLVSAHYSALKKRIGLKLDNSNYPGKRFELDEAFDHRILEAHLKDVKALLKSHGYNRIMDKFTNDHQVGQVGKISFSKFDPAVKKKLNFERLLLDKGDTRRIDPPSYHESDEGAEDDNDADPDTAVDCNYNPHTDAEPSANRDNILACVCYLSEDIHGGTGIYYNKALHTCSTDVNFWNELKYLLLEKIKELEGVVSIDERNKQIRELYISHHRKLWPRREADGPLNDSDEHFDLLHLFPMKFNRLVVYEGDLLHCLYYKDIGFYDKHERLTTNYFLPYEWTEGSNEYPMSDSDERIVVRTIYMSCLGVGQLYGNM